VSERPTYFSNINGGNAGTVSGGADVIGVQQLANDWLFAEGYTGGHFQENFVLANLDPARTTATVTIHLEYADGTSHAFVVSVNPLSQVIWNVNTNGTGATSQSVSAEITSSGARIVVEREMFFGYNHVGDGRTTTATGGSDVLGQVGAHSRYTVDMVAMVIQHMYHPSDGYNGYEISMAVRSSSGPFVVERPMYWNASGTQGGSDVIGFSG